MFAVLKTGGKQYKVQSGDMLRVEKLAADAGETVQFNDVLMIGGDAPVIGAPFVDGAAVQAEVVDQIKGDKVINFVKRRRKHGSQRTRGHRQQLTLVRVTEILSGGADASGVKAATVRARPAPRPLPTRLPREGRKSRRKSGGAGRVGRPQEAVGRRARAGKETARRRRDQFRADRGMDRRGCRRDGRETVVQGPDRA